MFFMFFLCIIFGCHGLNVVGNTIPLPVFPRSTALGQFFFLAPSTPKEFPCEVLWCMDPPPIIHTTGEKKADPGQWVGPEPDL